MWIVVGIFSFALLVLLLSMFALSTTGVPVVRTPPEHIHALATFLGPMPKGLIIDVGCADGRSLATLCQATGAKGRGYELNAVVWLWAWLRARLLSGNRGLSIRWADYRRADFEGVDLVYAFLMPSAMRLLGAKCREEMASGSRLVSFMWEVPDWQPVKKIELGSRKDPLFFYEVGHGHEKSEEEGAKNLTDPDAGAILKESSGEKKARMSASGAGLLLRHPTGGHGDVKLQDGRINPSRSVKKAAQALGQTLNPRGSGPQDALRYF